MLLNPYKLVLSILWLHKYNLEVDWVKETFSFLRYLNNLDCLNEFYKLNNFKKEFYNSKN